MVDLTIQNVSYSFLGKSILSPVSFTINESDKFAIFGSKNSGKTTLLLILAGVLNHKGKIFISPSKKPKVGLGIIEKINPLSEKMSVKDNLQFYLRQEKKSESAINYLKKFGLENIIKHSAEDISPLDRAILSFSISCIGNPDFIVLDEPTKDLTEKETREFWRRIDEEAANRTIIFTTAKESELHDATKFVKLDEK